MKSDALRKGGEFQFFPQIHLQYSLEKSVGLVYIGKGNNPNTTLGYGLNLHFKILKGLPSWKLTHLCQGMVHRFSLLPPTPLIQEKVIHEDYYWGGSHNHDNLKKPTPLNLVSWVEKREGVQSGATLIADCLRLAFYIPKLSPGTVSRLSKAESRLPFPYRPFADRRWTTWAGTTYWFRQR